jgi:hypothetical protein
MLISVISLQILSKFINISSIYHGYSVILDVGNIHEIQNLIWCFSSGCWHAMGGLRETFRGMMAASSCSALVWQSHGYRWPMAAQTAKNEEYGTKKQHVWQIN